MSDLSQLFAFYQDGSFNWNLIISWVLFLFTTKDIWSKVFGKLGDLVLLQLNKFKFFADTTLDEEMFEAAHAKLRTKVLSRMQDAQEIKEGYSVLIAEALKAGDKEKVLRLSQEKKDQLLELTHSIAREFMSDGEAILWDKLVQRYGEKANAAKWVIDKIKALAEELKDPSHPSTGALITKYLMEGASHLGKPSSNGEESGT